MNAPRPTPRSGCPLESTKAFVEFPAEDVERSIPVRFEKMVREHANRMAVRDLSQDLTYDELNRAANRVAHAILQRRGRSEEPIAFLAHQGVPQIVAILGILKAGKMYVPLEPSNPETRIAQVLDDSQTKLLVVDHDSLLRAENLRGNRDWLLSLDEVAADAAVSDEDLAPWFSADTPASILYTSSSTGPPKGVVQNHRGLLHAVMRYTNAVRLGQDDRLSLLSSCSFAASVPDIFGALLNGAVLLPFPLQDQGAARLADWLSQERVTVYHSVPTVFRHFVETLTGRETFPALRLINLGGEPVHSHDVELVRRHFPAQCLLHVGLGSTETHVVRRLLIANETAIADGPVSVGYATDDMQIKLLNGSGAEVGPGEVGEIAIKSRYLAVGYWRRPDLTEAAFLHDPEGDGSRTLRTGDLGRLHPDGCLEVVGREDSQVKIRGHRIELGEVEAALLALDAVKAAAVVVQGDHLGEPGLVAYLVPAGQSAPKASRLRSQLRARLPEVMVPSTFVMLDALPTTPTGKIDRRALPAANRLREASEVSYVSPRTPIESGLTCIWENVLGLERVGTEDRFLELGGHSLLATRILSQARDAFGVAPALSRFFETPTIAGLAGAITEELVKAAGEEMALSISSSAVSGSEEESRPVIDVAGLTKAPSRADFARRVATLSPAMRATIESQLLASGAHAAGYTTIARQDDSGPIPLSCAQQGMWLIDRMMSKQPLYNIARALQIKGALNVEALGAAFRSIVARHDTMRTTFDLQDDEPAQSINCARDFELATVDLRSTPPSDRTRRLKDELEQGARATFDLARDLMLRATLLRVDEEEYVLLLVTHHIAADGWSMQLLFRELSALYRDRTTASPSLLAELPIRYADFARWERRRRHSGSFDASLAYWKERLSGLPDPLELPADRRRPMSPTFQGKRRSWRLPQELGEDLQNVARQEGVTTFMLLLAALKALVSRYTSQDDIVIGSPFSNRGHVELEGLIGLFANTVVLRTDLSGDPSFRELLGRVRVTALDAFAHQDLPFELLVEALNPTRQLDHSPLFRIMFGYQKTTGPRLDLTGLELESLEVDVGTSKFDLTILVSEDDSGLRGSVEYSTDLFDHATIDRFLSHLQTLLEAAMADPACRLSKLRLLPEAERLRLLIDWSGKETTYPRESCLHHFFEQQVRRTPEDIAVRCGEVSLSYSALDRQASRVAHRLRAEGVGPDMPVGIMVERSVDMMVAVLGVLKAGGACLPLDREYPVDRLRFMVEDARAPLIVAQPSLHGGSDRFSVPVLHLNQFLTDDGEVENHRSEDGGATAANLAYVLYTSGSTGRPKGVAMSHRPIVNLVTWQGSYSACRPGARTLQFASLGFDVSFQEMFATWSGGGTLVIAPAELRRDLAKLWSLIESEGIEQAFLPVVVLQELAELAASLKSWPGCLREINVAGEALRVTPAIRDLFKRLSDCRLVNQYGPTEAHVVTAYTLEGPPGDWPEHPPIGRPIENARVFVLDPGGYPAPVGVAGELHLGGDCLARGYLHQPDLTSRSFISGSRLEGCPDRLYKTGDMARYRPDGNLEYLGRTDEQVKIRGFRVEPGEVETLLASHPAVRHAAVVVREDEPGDRRLVAYVVPSAHLALGHDDVREYLELSLPLFMIPSTIV
jgi:amino acid adenylation domain-containing protein